MPCKQGDSEPLFVMKIPSLDSQKLSLKRLAAILGYVHNQLEN